MIATGIPYLYHHRAYFQKLKTHEALRAIDTRQEMVTKVYFHSHQVFRLTSMKIVLVEEIKQNDYY